MIEERLRLIRGFYDAMRRRDLEERQAFERRFPDFEWRSAPDEIDHTPRLGAAGALAYSRNLFELRGAEEAREAAGA